ncbi:hypothetical protein [Mucilaginibacter phyllosphaerae]|uniref:Uncharacterized protein n=1 Tax=Mucilaginibacter phyllosphaerae TaxID=1812349 RepID=A0A4Y8ACY7_9SPHI|nr:hypothetical protein [Mucilaginibacter phyllosphaerae]MBB3970087.1 hypothetical protein [Mucilaginibacter phyllosphaerae]TEW66478.1 hypothetical protein E2R65_08605 [Mucilaginibacter phyllosphaerae]GGH09718.1 hypothetical protein GCM10007352_15190 [Mucilaginibacter phyllosphaerae]
MQEKFDVALPDGCLLPQNDRQLLAVIQTVFMPGSQPYTLLINALTEENKDKFGSSEFEGLQFEIKRFDPQVLTGRLRITYQLRLTFSCSAIVNNLNNQHAYWDFTINAFTNTAHFTGEAYGDLRSTADEF